MANNYPLTPKEAAFIAANAYFTLDGWEKRYAFIMSKSTGKAPTVNRGMASNSVIQRNVVGAGPRSVAQAGMQGASVSKSLEGSTGSNFGRVTTGFGYVLQFDRDGKKHVVVATRGTRPEIGYPDLLTDGNISIARHMPGIGPVHSGFFDTYNSLLPGLTAAYPVIDSADIVHCVGHSLGGAVANLVAVNLAKRGADVRLYTFGAPRVGLKAASYNKVMNALIGEENMFRVSHNLDPIPMIPIAPYIHIHPQIVDANNFFLGSPITSISMDNHDTNNYINSVGDKEWDDVRAAALAEHEVDKHFFQAWMKDESWLKRSLGIAGHQGMAVLLRILRGMLSNSGYVMTGIVTAFDLIALAIKSGLTFLGAACSAAVKFIGLCAKFVGMAVEVSQDALKTLLAKMMAELKIAAKLAMAAAAKLAKSKEFEIFLRVATTGSIGLMMI